MNISGTEHYVASFTISYQNGPESMAFIKKTVLVDSGVTVKDMMAQIMTLKPDSDIVIAELKHYVSAP